MFFSIVLGGTRLTSRAPSPAASSSSPNATITIVASSMHQKFYIIGAPNSIWKKGIYGIQIILSALNKFYKECMGLTCSDVTTRVREKQKGTKMKLAYYVTYSYIGLFCIKFD